MNKSLKRTLWQIGVDVFIVWPLIYFGVILSIGIIKATFFTMVFCAVLVLLITIFLVEDIDPPIRTDESIIIDSIRKCYCAISTFIESCIMAYYGSYILATLWMLMLLIIYHINKKVNKKL